MRFHWREQIPSGLACIAAATLTWQHMSFERRVQERVERAHGRAADMWTGLVQSGMSPDSATPLALGRLRRLLAGEDGRDTYPFVARPAIDSLWQALHLNPFRARAVQTPRTDVELTTVRASEVDVRLALAAGAPLVRARELRRLRTLDALVGVGVTGLVMWSAWQRRARRTRERFLATAG